MEFCQEGKGEKINCMTDLPVQNEGWKPHNTRTGPGHRRAPGLIVESQADTIPEGRGCAYGFNQIK